MKEKITTLELFGGIGAPAEAFKNCGADTKRIDYVEIIPYAVQAYNALHPFEYSAQDVITWNLDVDILVHGSPCQDFSKNGLNNINTGRSILFERTLSIIGNELLKKPKFVIWENVPNLLSEGKKVSHIKHFKHYVETMNSYGYITTHKIIDASDHGIAQKRKRMFAVSYLPEYNFEFPEARNIVPDIVDYLDFDTNFEDYKLTDNEMTLFFEREGQLFIHENTKAGERLVEEYDVINVERPKSTTRRGRVGKRMANTLTTTPFQVVYYDGKLRHMTAKEHFRLMGFDDEGYQALKNSGLTDKQISELSGNSICVPVLEDIFKVILNQIEGNNETIRTV